MAFFMGAMRGWLSELRMRAAKHMGRVGAFLCKNSKPHTALIPKPFNYTLETKP